MRKKCGMVEYLEVSAKTGDGVQAMFKAIINYEKLENKEPPQASVAEPAPAQEPPEPTHAKSTKRDLCNIC